MAVTLEASLPETLYGFGQAYTMHTLICAVGIRYKWRRCPEKGKGITHLRLEVQTNNAGS